jgi:hypothetical protein
MAECICSSCKNLKSIADENESKDNEIYETCEFGFPSEACEACLLDGCELTCDQYEKDTIEEVFVTKKCIACNTVLKYVASDSDTDKVYCVSCYLSKGLND